MRAQSRPGRFFADAVEKYFNLLYYFPRGKNDLKLELGTGKVFAIAGVGNCERALQGKKLVNSLPVVQPKLDRQGQYHRRGLIFKLIHVVSP